MYKIPKQRYTQEFKQEAVRLNRPGFGGGSNS